MMNSDKIKKELAAAYSNAFDDEFDAIILEAKEHPHVFSKQFENSMKKVLKTGKPDKLSTGKKKPAGKGVRLLLVAAVIVLALTAIACTVPEIRDSIAGFFVKVFGDHVEYTDPNTTKDRIEEEYGLVPIPEGYEKSNTINDGITITTIFENNYGKAILLVQSVNKELLFSVDNESGQFSNVLINDVMARIYLSEEDSQASWIYDGYFFSLTCPSDFDIIEMVKTVNVIDR